MEHIAVDELERRIEAVRVALREASSAALSSSQKLELVATLDAAVTQFSATRLSLIHEAALTAEPGHNVTDQLHATNRITRRRAHADVRLGAELAERFELIGRAWSAGTISEAQARAIVSGLKKAPAALSAEGHERRQADLIGYAAQFDPDDLLRLATRMAEVTDPEHAEAIEADHLARQARVAQAARTLVVVPDHHGSMLIRGQVPVAEGEVLLAQLEALMPSAASYQHTGDLPTRGARRADALVRLCALAAASGSLPVSAGDRPHVFITLDYETLASGVGAVSSVPTGVRLTAADARRIACDAHLIPAVLGAQSEVLDLGRSSRLFAGTLRRALAHRDQGCAFPGCDATPSACDAHHIIPWWAGGETSLSNGVLVCAYHHRLVEPDPQKPPEAQWQIHLDAASKLPLFTAPRHLDPERRPRLHRRHRLRGPTLPSTDPPRAVRGAFPEPAMSPAWVA